MKIKPLFAVLAAMAVTAAGCHCAARFSPSERPLIRQAEGGPMRVLTTADAADSAALRSKSVPLCAKMLASDEYASLRSSLFATVQDPQNPGVGIAAPQVGVFRRLVVVQRFDKPDQPFEVYINPEIEAFGGETAGGQEGCLSIPGVECPVERPQQITLRYRDEQFNEQTETIRGFTAVIFQHEIDHLDGVLFTDRATVQPVSEMAPESKNRP